MRNNNKGSIYTQSWSKLRKDKAAMLGLFTIVLAIIVSTLGGNIRPDSSPFANDGITAIARLKTGTTVKVLKVRKNKEVKNTSFFGKLFMGGQEPIYSTIPILDYRFEQDEIIVALFSSTNSTPQEKRIKLVDVCL